MLQDTYTYTARSANDPTRVVTFTFSSHHLLVDAGAPLELVERSLQAPAIGGDEAEPAEEQSAPWLKPLAVSAVERTTRPFHVSDVYAYSDDEDLLVSAWVRAGGLRVAPVAFHMSQVDNVDAAQAFVKELERRKAATTRPGRFAGLLDYWASWLIGGVTMAIALGALLRPKRETSE
jgi:hypothetical protein